MPCSIQSYSYKVSMEEHKNKIHVTKTYLPNKGRLFKLLDRVYASNWITNFGQLHQQLEFKLKEILNIPNIILTANGTLALQVAYKLLNIKNKVITTPFTFVATVSSLVWEGIHVLFADIDKDTFCIDLNQVEDILKKEKNIDAIVAVHVFGNACDVEGLEFIKSKYGVKIIYDASHCFGITYKGQSLLNFGDLSTISFHATKVFHTIEGGGIVCKDNSLYKRGKKLINFGIEDYYKISDIGINAKMNEFEAAMGLALIDEIDKIFSLRKIAWEYYELSLRDKVRLQKRNKNINNNFSYFPVLFESEKELIRVIDSLSEKNIFPRRYFYPSLDSLPYITDENRPLPLKNAHYVSKRVLCLPIYPGISKSIQDIIIDSIKRVI